MITTSVITTGWQTSLSDDLLMLLMMALGIGTDWLQCYLCGYWCIYGIPRLIVRNSSPHRNIPDQPFHPNTHLTSSIMIEYVRMLSFQQCHVTELIPFDVFTCNYPKFTNRQARFGEVARFGTMAKANEHSLHHHLSTGLPRGLHIFLKNGLRYAPAILLCSYG